jgi:glycosyltransferase involved in cell wall biosynthesis
MTAVLHVAQPCDGGVASYVAALSADQLARGWSVAVACPDSGRLAADLADQGVRRLAWQADRSPGPSAVGEARGLRRVLDRFGPDVVHLHSSKAGLAGRLAVKGRLPTMFQPHGWSWLASARWMVPATVGWERLAGRWTDLYVCICEAEAAQARLRGLRGQFRVVRNGVDLKRFERADEDDRRTARAHLGLPPEAPLVVCVGRLTRQKGQDVLLAAWPAVLAASPYARLALVGDGDLLEPLRRTAPPGVLFAGPVTDTRPWYAAADLVVLPSRWEGLPLTLLEALAVGRPVVASDIPGIAGELPRGAGALVPAGDAGALAEAITYRVRIPELVRAEGAAGARYVAAEADLRRTYDLLAAVTVGLAGGR